MAWSNLKAHFKKVGELVCSEQGRLRWTANAEAGEAGSVYVWILSPGVNEPETVLYVGKAKAGWVKRHAQHTSGMGSTFREIQRCAAEQNELSGEWCRQYLERARWLEEGRQIYAYEKLAQLITLFEQEHSAEDAEEKILIRLLSPRYNRA